jgi:hypothetical protein
MVGNPSAAQPVTISNFGGSPLDVSSISASGVFAETSTCPSQLAAGSTCTVSVTFTPSALGPANGLLMVADDSGNAGAVQTVSLSGTGLLPVTLGSDTVDFGTVTVDETSAVSTVTLTNNENVTLHFVSIAASAASAGFAVASNTCGASIAAGASCTVGVTFSPRAPGAVAGSLTFTDDAGNSPQIVKLSGTGVAPPVTVRVTANGTHGTLTLHTGDPLAIAFAVDTNWEGPLNPAQLYIGVVTPFGVMWLGPSGFGPTPTPLYSGALPSFGPVTLVNIPNVSALPTGDYTWFMVVNSNANGVVNAGFDSVQTTIAP